MSTNYYRKPTSQEIAKAREKLIKTQVLNRPVVIQRNLLLSKSDIEYLQSVGFKQDNSKNSGFYYYEDDRKTTVLVPQENGTYKLEFFEICDDGDGNYYEDFDKEYSTEGQTLQQFIEEWF